MDKPGQPADTPELFFLSIPESRAGASAHGFVPSLRDGSDPPKQRAEAAIERLNRDGRDPVRSLIRLLDLNLRSI